MTTEARLGEYRTIETKTGTEMRMRVMTDVRGHADGVRAAQLLKVTATTVGLPRAHVIPPAGATQRTTRAPHWVHLPLTLDCTNQAIWAGKQREGQRRERTKDGGEEDG